jgi:hypothetical protein
MSRRVGKAVLETTPRMVSTCCGAHAVKFEGNWFCSWCQNPIDPPEEDAR